MVEPRPSPHKFLHSGQLIEVRKAAPRASWFPAKLLELHSNGTRKVEFEAGGQDSIAPSPRGEPCNVRPRPPSSTSFPTRDWKRGLLVEAFKDSTWQEGLFLGTETGAAQVLFPDSGEKQNFSMDHLRVSHSWSQQTNSWELRGYELRALKPQRTFERKKKRKVEGEPPAPEDPVIKDSIKRQKQEPNGPVESPAPAPAAAPATAPEAPAEPIIEYVDVEPMQGIEEDDHLEDGEAFRLTNTLPIPVCCINTEDPLFGEDPETSSQGSFYSSKSFRRNISLSSISRASRKKRKAILENHRRDSLREARENAIRNLESSGWRKALRERQRENRTSKEAYYIAPDGTSYHSLTSACAAWMLENKNVSKSVREAMQSYQTQIIVRRNSPLGEPEMINGAGPEKRRYRRSRTLETTKGRPRLNALLPRKGDEREARRLTMFSWLIDSGVLVENGVVFGLNGESQGVSKGFVSRDGIVCLCCSRVFNIRGFQAHGDPQGSGLGFSSRVVMEDGRSLLVCQKQALKKMEMAGSEVAPGVADESDECCGLCGEVGELICCDSCPATYHLHCVLLKSLPEGDWYCPKCRCPGCGLQFDGREVLYCAQCERNYHVQCLNSGGPSHLKCSFCSQSCLKVYCGLRDLVGITSPLEGGYTWTLLRSSEEDGGDTDIGTATEHSTKLALALTVMQECFSPMIDPRRKVDIITHILKNRSSDVKRLDFRGFYCFTLERKDELISVAAIRIHGANIAEMPLIGTRLQFRRQGMCRRLMEVIEQVLRSLGVETLVLPAVPELLDTWIGAFGFQKVTPIQSVRLLEFNLVGFPGTKVLQKPLAWLNLCRKIAPPLAERSWIPGNPLQLGIDSEPHRKPRQQKLPAVVKTEDFSTPVAHQPINNMQAPASAPAAAVVAPSVKEEAPLETAEDSRIVVTKTRSNRLVKASKRVVEALQTLKNKEPEVEFSSPGGEECVENTNELSFLRLGSSQIVMNNVEASTTTSAVNEVEELRSSTLVAFNSEAREPENYLFEDSLLDNNKEGSEQLFLSRLKVRTCGECGTSETPMWRRALANNLDLCNACGIRRKKMYMRLAASEEKEEI